MMRTALVYSVTTIANLFIIVHALVERRYNTIPIVSHRMSSDLLLQHHAALACPKYAISNSDTSDGGDKIMPSLIIFDLDGCLWRPEMYELLYFSGGAGGPFTKSPDYETDGTLLTTKDEPVRLLGQVRQIMASLHHTQQFAPHQIGISSRTNQPDWARELLQKFTILSEKSGDEFALTDMFGGPIEIASDSKVNHFQRISDTTGVPLDGILFFDNERDNCREIANLGVAVGYCPDGVTQTLWDICLDNFAAARGQVVGLDIFSYDSLEGAELFYDGEDYRRTQW